MENAEEKNLLFSSLKDEIKKTLQDEFVDNYSLWQKKMELVNSTIKLVNKDIAPYSYNEFCLKTLEATNKILEEVDYNNLFLSEEEYTKMRHECKDNIGDLESLMTKAIGEKIMNNLTFAIAEAQLKESVKAKINHQQFATIENMLNRVVNMAMSIVNLQNNAKKF